MASRYQLTWTVTRDLLIAIDSRLQSLSDRERQLEFLAEHIARYRPQKTQRKAHTVKSLETQLQTAVKTHRENSASTWTDVWQLGSRMLKEPYWNKIRDLPSVATTERTVLENIQTAPRAYNVPSDEGLPPVLGIDRHEADSSNWNDSSLQLDRENAKRPAAEIACSGDDGQTSSPRKLSKFSRGSVKDAGVGADLIVHNQSAGQSDPQNVPHQSQVLQDLAAPTVRQHTKAVANDVPVDHTPSIDDINAGRVTAPIRDIRSTLSTSEFNQNEMNDTVRELWPPEYQEPGLTDTRRMERAAAVCAVKGQMEDLGDKVFRMSKAWCTDNGISTEVKAEFVLQPTPGLEELYRSILGQQHWRWASHPRRLGPNPWSLDVDLVISSMIAAFVYDNVFCGALPWDIKQRLRDNFGTDVKFAELSMLDKGHDFDDFLRQWSFKMHSDANFRESRIRPHACELAAKLRRTLMPHMALANMRQDANDHSNPDGDIDWLRFLEDLCERALVLKGTAATYHEVDYEYTWCESGSRLKRGAAMPLHQRTSAENEVLVTIWPGMRLRPNHIPGSSAEKRQLLVLAKVHARPWLEDGEDDQF